MEPPENSTASRSGGEGAAAVGFEDAQKIIMRWDSTASEEAIEKMIFESNDRDEVDRYLKAVDELQKSMSTGCLIADDHDKVNSTTIQIAMARLEDEFRNVLLNHTSPVELDSLTATDPSSSVHVTVAGDFEEDDHVGDEDMQDPIQRADSSASNSSTSYRSTSSIREINLIPPEAVSDLQSIAKRMISAGHLRECSQVYGTSS